MGLKGIEQSLKQKWYCSQVEKDFGEGDVMDWYQDDEMMRQWEETSKEAGESYEEEDGRNEPTS